MGQTHGRMSGRTCPPAACAKLDGRHQRPAEAEHSEWAVWARRGRTGPQGHEAPWAGPDVALCSRLLLLHSRSRLCFVPSALQLLVCNKELILSALPINCWATGRGHLRSSKPFCPPSADGCLSSLDLLSCHQLLIIWLLKPSLHHWIPPYTDLDGHKSNRPPCSHVS